MKQRQSRLAAFMFLLAVFVSYSKGAVPGRSNGICRTLPDLTHRALLELVEDSFPPPGVGVCGLRFNERQMQELARSREKSVPCVLVIRRSGLAAAGVWRRPDRPPDARNWSTSLIGAIDPVLAIRLYSEDLRRTSDRWKRLEILVHMLELGDTPAAAALVALLSEIDPATIRPGRHETAQESRVLNALTLLVRRDVREALPVLEKVVRVIPDRPYLGVWAAQLRRDAPALEQFARRGDVWSFALESLARIGAWDILGRLAAEPTFYGRENARMLVDKRIPSPPRVESMSPCAVVDAAGRALLSYRLSKVFPAPGPARREIECDNLGRPLVLIRQAQAASACIEDLFRHGVIGTGLWQRPDPEPYGGVWALPLLVEVNPVRAAQLWREWGEAPGRDDWERAAAAVSRAKLDDREAVPALIAFLKHPAAVSLNRGQNFRYLVEDAAFELIRLDYRPARGLLRDWRTRGFLRSGMFEIGIAKLERDGPALERLARSSQQATEAIRALGSIGATDALKRLAADTTYEYHGWAEKELLAKR